MVVVDDEEEDDDVEDDDMTPICSVLVVLLWYSLFRVAFLPLTVTVPSTRTTS